MILTYRILYLITGLAIGGAETQLVRVATRLKQRGYSVRVVTLLPYLAYKPELEQAGIPVTSLGIQRKIPDPRALVQLVRLIRRWKPDIVHSHMVHANLFARITRLFAPVPVLISSARSIREGGWWRERLYRLTDPLCDLTTHVCEEGAKRYVQEGLVPAHKMRTMPNGVDTEQFYPDSAERARLRAEWGVEGRFVWLAVGRLEAPKDYPNMLHAMHAVKQAYPDTLVLIAGDGPLRASLESLSRSLELEENVRFLGVRRDVPQLMRMADAFVLSSSREGLPNVLLEAQASGLPAVVTDVGGNREVVCEGETGFIVPPGDSSALAERMIHLMRLPNEKLCRMGESGRDRVVEYYSMESVVNRWIGLYEELLKTKRAVPTPAS